MCGGAIGIAALPGAGHDDAQYANEIAVAPPRADGAGPPSDLEHPVVPDSRALSHPPGVRLRGTGLGGCTRCGWSDVSRWPARCGPEGSRAEPLLRGRLLGKSRLLEPKSPVGQDSR